MILNNADNIMFGRNEADKIYLGSNEIWVRDSEDISGPPPLTFSASRSALAGYTIIGSENSDIGVQTPNLIEPVSNDSWKIGYSIDTTGEEVARSENMSTDFISILPNTQYYLSFDRVHSTSIWNRRLYYDSNQQLISYEDINSQGYSFTTPNNAAYIRMSFALMKNPMLIQGSSAISYKPMGYEVPIIFNSVKRSIFLPQSLKSKKLISYRDGIPIQGNNLTFYSGPFNYASGSGTPSHFTVDGPTNGHYVANGLVKASLGFNSYVDKYIVSEYGNYFSRIDDGTYTLCLTIHNPPKTTGWRIWAFMGTRSYDWRGTSCDTSNIRNNVAKSSLTFTVNSSISSYVSFMLIRFEGSDDAIYNNTVIDVRILPGTAAEYATYKQQTSDGGFIELGELPQLITTNGTNTFDVNTSPKPSLIKVKTT